MSQNNYLSKTLKWNYAANIAVIQFLADRTNSRTVASVCRRRRLWRYVLWLNGASQSKSYYWEPIGSRIWEIDWYHNEWPWPLFRGRIKVTSTIALHLTLNISENVRDEAWFQKTTNRKWHMGYRMVTW